MRERREPLKRRLESGDDLHREALAAINRLETELRELERDARHDARDAFVAGQWAERDYNEGLT